MPGNLKALFEGASNIVDPLKSDKAKVTEGGIQAAFKTPKMAVPDVVQAAPEQPMDDPEADQLLVQQAQLQGQAALEELLKQRPDLAKQLKKY